MHYDITKLSEADAQIVGYALEKFLKRVHIRIEKASENLAYQTSCKNKYGGEHWQKAIDETARLLDGLEYDKAKVSDVLNLMRD